MARGLNFRKYSIGVDDQAQIKRHVIPSPFGHRLLILDYRTKGEREIKFQTKR